MAATALPEPDRVGVTGVSRVLSLPSCVVSADDLRRLYQLLSKKTAEAARLQFSVDEGPWKNVKGAQEAVAQGRKNLQLAVTVLGTSGEWTAGTSPEILSDNSLPAGIIKVVFDSAFNFRNATGVLPMNWFTVTLDFSRTSILDMKNLALEPSANESSAQIQGTDTTWVNGVYQELQMFFDERRRTRNWLHSRFAYDAAVLLVGFPASFAFVYRVDRILRPILQLPDALFVALYVYLVLVALLGFRLAFNYAKWVFPKLEGPNRREGGPKLHKAFLVLVGGTLVAWIIDSFLRMVGSYLF